MQSTQSSAFDYSTVKKLTLCFRDKTTETSYLKATANFRYLQMRLALILVGLLYCISASFDPYMLPVDLKVWVSQVHLLQGVSYIILGLLTFQWRSKKLLYTTLLSTITISWLVHLWVTYFGKTTVYFPEVYFMLMWIWLGCGFALSLSTKMNVFYFILLEVTSYFYCFYPIEAVISHHLFLLISIALGALGGYLMEYHRRRSFFHYQAAVKAKQQAEEAIKTKDKFFSIISHDLRGPIGNIAVLFNEFFEDGSQITDDLFASIKSTSSSAFELLENLLMWSQSQKGEIEHNPTNFAVVEPIQNSLNLLQGQALQKGIQLNYDLSADMFVKADLQMVTTIIRNLVNNAVKFTPQGGEIAIRVINQGDYLRIEVRDNGVGMAPEVQNSLFQLDQKTNISFGTQNEKGSGLGLILCAEFVKHNEGQIGVTSELGQGSCFWFTLPKGKVDTLYSPSTELSEAPKLTKDLSKLQVLLVDDNDLHLKTSGLIIEELGIQFQTAGNGKDAFEQFQQGNFDVVLMDIDMPVMNGVESNLAIREYAKDANPIIIALSSNTKFELTQLAESAPFDGYLTKPLNPSKLLSILE